MALGKVKYPAIVICGQGTNDGVLKGAFAFQVWEYLKSKGEELPPLFDYQVMNKSTQDAWMEKWSGGYLEDKFPGLDAGQSPLSIIQLMTTKSPRSLIRAEVALEGGYDPCEGKNFTDDPSKTPRCRVSTGFSFLEGLNSCYKPAPEFDLEFCDAEESELFSFWSDTEVTNFINILKTGRCF